jgi:hypothetical protein
MGVRFVIIFGESGLSSPLSVHPSPSFEGRSVLVIHLFSVYVRPDFATVSLNVRQTCCRWLRKEQGPLDCPVFDPDLLTSAVSPMLGVSIYSALRSNQSAMGQDFFDHPCLRLVSVGALVLPLVDPWKEPNKFIPGPTVKTAHITQTKTDAFFVGLAKECCWRRRFAFL